MKNKSTLVFISVLIASNFIIPRIMANMANKSAIPFELKLRVAAL